MQNNRPSANQNNSRQKLPFLIDAHHRLTIAVIASVVAAFVSKEFLPATETILVTWMCFALVNIVFEWLIILKAHPQDVRRLATLQDSSRTVIFLFIVIGTMISLLSIVFLMKSPANATSEQVTFHVMLNVLSVIISWWLVHTVFTLRYAHSYYKQVDREGKEVPACGLKFPGEDKPDYMDFIYFSFNMGVAFQVSDVAITSSKMRRLVWLHSLISFAFNTAIVALSINIVSGLLSKN
jgi:uncharacterized membrane protein